MIKNIIIFLLIKLLSFRTSKKIKKICAKTHILKVCATKQGCQFLCLVCALIYGKVHKVKFKFHKGLSFPCGDGCKIILRRQFQCSYWLNLEVHGLGFPIAVCFLTTSVFSFFYQSVIFPFFF